MDVQTDLKGLVKATVRIFPSIAGPVVFKLFQNEFVKRMDTVSSGLAPTMNYLLRQASLRILNQSSIPTLVKRLQKPNHLASDNSLKLLKYAAKHLPALYKSHIGELVKGVADEKHPLLVEAALQALAAVVRWDEKVVPTDKCVASLYLSLLDADFVAGGHWSVSSV